MREGFPFTRQPRTEWTSPETNLLNRLRIGRKCYQCSKGLNCNHTHRGEGDLPSLIMPTYTFENESGVRAEANKPIGTTTFIDRGTKWKRITEPEGFRMHTGAQLPDQKEQMRRGYNRLENRGWISKFSKQQVKRVWDI